MRESKNVEIVLQYVSKYNSPLQQVSQYLVNSYFTIHGSFTLEVLTVRESEKVYNFNRHLHSLLTLLKRDELNRNM